VLADFSLVRLLGRGGMGEVWEAREESLRRHVALKLMLPQSASQRTVDYFTREARAGGKLSHPGIVAVYGSGEHDGTHWIAMELVPGGASLQDFLEDVRGEAELPGDYYRRVAELTAAVAEAMEFAHGAGVIHRDLKPANVLVTPDDRPRVADFGLARVESEHELSRTGDFAGTYYYMSPEQVMAKRMGLDHRTDIFSLGAVLYELLTLQRPFVGDTAHQIAQSVVTVDPPDPRTLRSRVPVDLAVICAKALEKNPDHRYPTMAELAADLRRHLDHETIHARPPTVAVRATKWVRRHPARSAAGAVAAIALVAVSSLAWRLDREAHRLIESNLRLEEKTLEARHQADLAVERAEELHAVSRFQADQLSGIDAQAMGLTIRAMVFERARVAGERTGRPGEVLAEEQAELESLVSGADFTGLALGVLEAAVFDRALASLRRFDGQPLLQARLLQVVASTMRELGLWEAALAPQERALELRSEHLGAEHADTLVSNKALGHLLSDMGRVERAEAVLRRQWEAERRLLGEEHLGTLVTLNALGGVLHVKGERDGAEAIFREVEEAGRRTLGADHATTQNALNNLGILHHEGGRLEEAEPLYREALETSRRLYGEGTRETLSALNNLASLLAARGEFDAALPLLRDVVAGERRLMGDEHPATLNSTNNLADLLKNLGRTEEAERLYRECLATCRRTLGAAHPTTLACMNNFAVLLEAQRRDAEAEPLFLEALEAARRSLGEGHPRTLAMRGSLGICYQNQDRLADAEHHMRAWLDGSRRVIPAEHPDLLVPLLWLARVLVMREDLTAAEPLYREALEIRRRSLGPDHLETLSSLTAMGAVLSRLGRWEEACRLLERASDDLDRTQGVDHPATVRARQRLDEARAGLAGGDG
jgi:tetratricopeptide (TPR) repeat protein